MTARTTKRLVWGSWIVAVALAALAGLFLLLGRSQPQPADTFGFRGFAIIFAVAFATVGALVASRRPENPIGWIFCAMGVGSGLQELAQQYAIYAVLVKHDTLPLGHVAAWFPSWIWIPITSGAGFLFALFPTGKLTSPRWRAALLISAVGVTIGSIGFALAPGPLENFSPVDNPFGIRGAEFLNSTANLVGLFIYGWGMIACAASLVARFRRSRSDERAQLKWLAFSAAFVGIALMSSFVETNAGGTREVVELFVILSFVTVPLATGIAILRHRLFDIDVVISKTLAYGALAAFITGVYVAIAVGVGSALGNRGNAALSIVATALVAIAFQPVRARVQRVANRLVYGKRATPYEVMAGFSHRVAGTLSVEDVLPGMAEAAARGVGATRGRVRLVLPGGSERSVSWPDTGDGFMRTIDVTYQGRPIGEIGVEKPQGEELTPAEEKLLTDLASQAGLAMHNVRLTEELDLRLRELAEQSAQLQVSRQRLVTARDAQRRGLERDIREGPQHQLTDIGRRLAEATELTDRNPAAAGEVLDRLGEQANRTLEGLRDLARGIFPPLLAEKGVAAAIDAHVRKVTANATIEASSAFALARFDADTEAGIYSCCLQALQNVVRHAANAHATIRLSYDGDAVDFAVADDGPGFDVASTPRGMGLQIMQDRVEALSGSLDVRSEVGAGTTVAGRLPARAVDVVT